HALDFALPVSQRLRRRVSEAGRLLKKAPGVGESDAGFRRSIQFGELQIQAVNLEGFAGRFVAANLPELPINVAVTDPVAICIGSGPFEITGNRCSHHLSCNAAVTDERDSA